ncbi:MAG: HdeD family acid-resistance protein, partial [Bacteroidetes bacterium]
MPLIKGIILVILSILVFMNPEGAILGLALYIGIALLFAGFVLVISAISYSSQIKGWGWRLAEGLLDIFVGFIL